MSDGKREAHESQIKADGPYSTREGLEDALDLPRGSLIPPRATEIIAAIRRQLEINVQIAERDHPEGPIIDGKRVKGVAHSQDILAQHIRDHLNDLERSIADHYAPLNQPANPQPETPEWWRDEAAAEREFMEYFCRNYPEPYTMISDPKWHAPKIFRAAKRALLATVVPPPARPRIQAPSDFEEKLSDFLEALDEWGCDDNAERAQQILEFQRTGYDLDAYLVEHPDRDKSELN